MENKTENKGEAFKNILIYLGVLLILVGSTATKGDNLAFFFLGLVILSIQTFEFKAVKPKSLATAEVILSASLSIATVSQLVMAKSFGAPQVFQVILLLGAVLIVVESVRKLTEA